MPPSKVIGFIEAREVRECFRKYDLQSIKNEKSEEIANIIMWIVIIGCYLFALSIILEMIFG